MEGQKLEEKEISHFMLSSQIHSLLGSWDSAWSWHEAKDLKRLNIPANVAEKALDEMYGAIKDIEALVKGYSHFFLEDPLCYDHAQ